MSTATTRGHSYGDEDESIHSSPSSSTMENVTRLFARQNFHDIPVSRMYEVSVEERTTAFQDLHGALEYVTETPELVEQRLAELEQALLRLPAAKTEVLRQAMEHNMAYVESLKLCFLRAEHFDAERSAIRMAGHFETKPELLGRDIMLSDLDDEHDLLGLRLGIFQLLKSRDRVGRAIVFMHPGAHGNGKLHHQLSMFRLAFWFISLAARLGEDVQRRGIVFIWWGIQPPFDPEMRGRGPTLINLIFPTALCFVSAAHATTDDIRMKTFFDEVAMAAKANYLVRFQTHFGSALECQSNLNTFGIPSKILPLTSDGQVHCHDHVSFLSQLRHAESDQGLLLAHPMNRHPMAAVLEREKEELALTSEEIVPGPEDIISGRGKRGSKYRGNSKLRDVIEDHFESYEEGSSVSRRAIARSIYLSLIQSGSRFLNFSEKDNGWSELDEDAAIEKILHCFRNHRLKVNKQNREKMHTLD